MRLWLEQKKNNPEGKSCSILRLPCIHCSSEQKKELERMAKSRTLGIWRMKRAKVILGALEGKTLERLVLDVRVPPETIVKCVEAFSKQGTESLRNPTRKPTQRETRVEKMLGMLETPSKQKGREWRYFTVRCIGIDFTGPMIKRIRALSVAHPGVTRVGLSQTVCREFGFHSPAAWRLAGRDAFIGWDDQQREKHLNQIIGNSRFLILPWIKCPNLASMILGRMAGRVTSDWKTTYGIEPVLLETFVQQDRFSGTCYRAANWIDVGSTGGYSYFSNQKKNIPPKTIFLYPLCKNFREVLCRPPASRS